MAFWLSAGVVDEAAPGEYRLVGDQRSAALRHASRNARDAGGAVDDDSDDEPGPNYAEDAEINAKKAVNRQYIVGMLTNLGTLPIDRILNMLKMFAPSDGGRRRRFALERALRATRFGPNLALPRFIFPPRHASRDSKEGLSLRDLGEVLRQLCVDETLQFADGNYSLGPGAKA
ncbi:hypothetical protein M885DRAFT_497553 [Pelagophyceae sp. CCMP2097]|nr:hypothetical protein M885DRAFT_497553 [Pelagophyceae sp. CCMP2097]